MGKAAIIIVPIVIVGVALLFVGGIAAISKWATKPDQEPKEVRKKAQLADEAYDLFRDIRFPKSIDGDISYLNETHKAKVKSWVEKYGKAIS